jgi:hypothetical protein
MEYRISVAISATRNNLLKHKNFGAVGNKKLECEFWYRIVLECTQPSFQWVLEDFTPEVRWLEG